MGQPIETTDPGFYDFLNEEFLSGSGSGNQGGLFPDGIGLDAVTLAAALGMGDPAMSDAVALGLGKRDAPEEDDESGDEGEGGHAAKKGRGSEAAKNKACREKARREKLNEK